MYICDQAKEKSIEKPINNSGWWRQKWYAIKEGHTRAAKDWEYSSKVNL